VEVDFKSDRYEGYHMPRIVVDIAGARPVHLAILDGIESCVGGEGPWMSGSKYCHPGVLAEEVGIGSVDLNRIEVVGSTIKDALHDFEARWKGREKV
jgi:hypothetical protein